MSGTRPSRITLRLGDQLLEEILTAEITRDLEEISGGFRIEFLDMARMNAARPAWWRPGLTRGPVQPREAATVAIDGEVVLIGRVDKVEVSYAASKLLMTVTGRDKAGELVDCAAAPNGPAEYRNLSLTEICTRLCQPFGITVTADVDVGGPFPKFGIEPGETAMSAIEKACRQRGVLAVSDGVGGLRLTRGGRTPAPAPLSFGENISTLDATFDFSERFAEYIVKGQGARTGGTALTRTAIPAAATAEPLRPAPISPAGARPRVVMTGRALDPAVTGYRPTVSMAKTQSGGASVQEQADWRMRTHRAKSESIRVTVQEFRDGPENRLWRVNERVWTDDPLSQASHELLVASLLYRYGPAGSSTEMKLCGCDAFDVLEEGVRTRRSRGAQSRATVRTAVPASADPAPPASSPAGRR